MKPPTISVNFYDSLRSGAFQFYRRVVPDKYTHTISAFGGYDAATITLGTTRAEAEDWLESGIMRHVVVYASALDVIWEGFVDEVRINMGALTATYGPLLNMANRVYITYTPTTEGTYSSVEGSTDVLTQADDAESQARFGIFPVVLSGGSITAAQAAYQQATYLEDNRWPKLTQSWSSESSKPVTVTLKCKGYMHLLNFPYFGTLPTLSATDTILDVLAANPNISWLAYDDDNIETNAIEVPSASTQVQLGLSAIKGAVAIGDTSAARWLFYILKDLKAYYHAAPTDIEYRALMEQGGMIVRSDTQTEIEPHRMLPGKWMSIDDFLVGRHMQEINTDPRLMFIEGVTFRAPFGLRLAGGTTDEINQVMARFGLGGTA